MIHIYRNSALIISLFLSFTSCKTDITELYKTKTLSIAQSAGIPIIQVAFSSKEGIISFEAAASDTAEVNLKGNTVFQAASLSKPIFSYVVLRLMDRGLIDIDTPLYKYTQISRFENSTWAQMLTARMVLAHRTGLPNWATSPSGEQWPNSIIKFNFIPDSAFSYSGEGFYLLQQAVEDITGKSLEQLTQEEVFTPLEMHLSSYTWMDCYDTLAACGYTKSGENRGQGRHPRANSAYTLRTTANDYMKFLLALIKGDGLKPQSHIMMNTADTKAFRYYDRPRDCDKHIFWGLGIGIEKESPAGDILFHWGDNGNFKSLFIIAPESEKIFVYFTNSANGHDIIDQMTALFFNTGRPFKLSEWVNN